VIIVATGYFYQPPDSIAPIGAMSFTIPAGAPPFSMSTDASGLSGSRMHFVLLARKPEKPVKIRICEYRRSMGRRCPGEWNRPHTFGNRVP
jgi:hypothetical protein